MKVKAQDSMVNQSKDQSNTYEDEPTKVPEAYFTGDFNLDLEVIKKKLLITRTFIVESLTLAGLASAQFLFL